MIANKELSNRFDVLYNNIMSDRAPGLSEYEKSVFFNKAQLETLKNKLNPKGNKYGEGFDFSSKRQLEFSELTVSESHFFDYSKSPSGTYNPRNWKCNEPAVIDAKHILCIINEALDVVPKSGMDAFNDVIDMLTAPQTFNLDYNNDGTISISDITLFIDDAISGGLSISEEAKIKFSDLQTNYLLGGQTAFTQAVLESAYTLEKILNEFGLTHDVIVVPINNIEYDTLTSRPFKYPPKQ